MRDSARRGIVDWARPVMMLAAMVLTLIHGRTFADGLLLGALFLMFVDDLVWRWRHRN